MIAKNCHHPGVPFFRTTFLFLFLFLFLFFCRLSMAQTSSAAPAEKTRPAVQVGQEAPAFTLHGLGDDPIALSDYRANDDKAKPGKNVVIVFVRAHW